MKKDQFPIFQELTVTANEDSTEKGACKCTGTDNPRHLRVIHALMVRSRKREEIDRIAGASNGPELIAELRRRGLRIHCEKVPAIDRDGCPINPGVYEFDDDDRRKITAWKRKRDAGSKA